MRGVYKLKTLVLVAGLCIAAPSVYAQSATDTTQKVQPVKKAVPAKVPFKPKVKKIKPISKELSIGGRLNSDGWSAFADLGKVKSDDSKHSDQFYNIRLLQLEFSEKKSPKEIKNNSSDAGSGSNPGSYIYGKINNFYALKLGWGIRRMIAGKPEQGTVSIHWVNAGGVSVGLLKPYYIKALTASGEQPIKYSDDTKDEFLNQSDIIGKAGFAKGLGETQIIPGLHFKTALHFDFTNNRKLVFAAEAGINAEVYSKSIQLMATETAVPYFLDAYVSLQFGKRW